MATLCETCEYGKRYVYLGKCPDCKTGIITGDYFTREFFCSNNHEIKSIAISFSGYQNCYNILFTQYDIFLSGNTTKELLILLGKLINMPASHLYIDQKRNIPISRNLLFKELLTFGKQLTDNQITYNVIPKLPFLDKFSECYPEMANTYKYVMKNITASTKKT